MSVRPVYDNTSKNSSRFVLLPLCTAILLKYLYVLPFSASDFIFGSILWMLFKYRPNAASPKGNRIMKYNF